MARYRLTAHAKADLWRIYQRGLERWGEAQGDAYYHAFFDRFEQIARQPYLYQAVDDIREGVPTKRVWVDSIYYRIAGETVEIMAIIGQQGFDNSVLPLRFIHTGRIIGHYIPRQRICSRSRASAYIAKFTSSAAPLQFL